ncbi:MAG: type II and III secretion system protein family protein [Sulfuriferula sp.]|nr:type II and III secretion system protein family protein [Sulfuriferula sp.]
MKQQEIQDIQFFRLNNHALILGTAVLLALSLSVQATAATKKKTKQAPAVKQSAVPVPVSSTIELAPQINATIGKSTLLRLPAPASRISVGNPAVADVILLSPSEIYLLGKSVGSTNIIVWNKGGQATVVDVSVGMDAGALQGKLQQLLPGEKDIKVNVAADSLVLTGTVADAVKVDRVMALAEAYAGKKVVNMLQVSSPQQVMLEVKVAEVSKTLVDKLGAEYNAQRFGPSWSPSFISSFLVGGLGGNVNFIHDANNSLSFDAQRNNDLVKILAEPTIMAMSGQEGSFLAGGKIFIPVPQTGVGGTTITLEEKEFGVGLKFTPTVLEGGRINLRVTPEVSELSTTGTTVTSGNTSSILPTITTRRASTTVQLLDGQSFAIGGLIKNNITQNVKAFPGLGELPILGALFRSSGFQNDRTELMFVVTPHLVKPLPPDYKLPTDNFIEPSRSEFFLGGKMEGKPADATKPAEPAKPVEPTTPAPAVTAPKPQSGSTGFEMK